MADSLKYIIFLGILTFILCPACKSPEGYYIPSSYSFDPQSYSGQTQRLDMFETMIEEINTRLSSTQALDESLILNQFSNSSMVWGNDEWNTSTKQLRNKCYLLDQDLLDQTILEMAGLSQAMDSAYSGLAGWSGTDLVDDRGLVLNSYFESKIMSSCFYYQMVGVYLEEGKTGDDIDNSAVDAEKGTTLQHHWDEAFGYFGVPTGFPDSKTNLRSLGEKSEMLEEKVELNSVLMNAFIKGRAAIGENDLITKNQQRNILKTELDYLMVSLFVHYLNTAENQSLGKERNRNLSLALSISESLGLNSFCKMSPTVLEEITSSLSSDLYTFSDGEIISLKEKIEEQYAFGDQLNTL